MIGFVPFFLLDGGIWKFAVSEVWFNPCNTIKYFHMYVSILLCLVFKAEEGYCDQLL